jgi:hypothetical protein
VHGAQALDIPAWPSAWGVHDQMVTEPDRPVPTTRLFRDGDDVFRLLPCSNSLNITGFGSRNGGRNTGLGFPGMISPFGTVLLLSGYVSGLVSLRQQKHLSTR